MLVPDPADASRSAAVPAVLPALAWVAAAAAFAVMTWRAWPFTVDDAYITLRYARHLAEGLGPVFNATGPRAEGCTSFPWMLLLAVPQALGLDALLVAKLLGVLATLATVAVAARWAARECGGAAWAAAAAALVLCAQPALAVHAVSGMETALESLLLTATFAAGAGLLRHPARARPAPVVALALLASLTRPEGSLAAGLVLAVVTAALPPGRRRGFALAAALGWLLPFAAAWAARAAWYGLPWPLPFYVKVAGVGPFAGWPVVREWLVANVLVLGLPLAFVLVRPPRTLLPALAATFTLTLFFVRPEHVMGYQHRYLAPLDPALAVLAVVGLARIAARVGARAPVLAARLALPLLLAALVAGIELAGAPAALAGRRWYAEDLARAHERLGRVLAGVHPAGRLLVSDAGAIPYLSGWWTLDMVGLNDARIATTGDRAPETLLASRPDVIVLVSLAANRFVPFPRNPWEAPLLEAARRDGFRGAARLRFDEHYWLWVFARPGSPAATALAQIEPPAAR